MKITRTVAGYQGKTHSRYRYFDEAKWAEQFLEGELLFRSGDRKIGHGEKRTRKWEQAISALLLQPTIELAARSAGIMCASPSS